MKGILMIRLEYMVVTVKGEHWIHIDKDFKTVEESDQYIKNNLDWATAIKRMHVSQVELIAKSG